MTDEFMSRGGLIMWFWFITCLPILGLGIYLNNDIFAILGGLWFIVMIIGCACLMFFGWAICELLGYDPIYMKILDFFEKPAYRKPFYKSKSSKESKQQ